MRARAPCRHQGQPVRVGPYTVWAAGGNSISDACVDEMDVLVTLGGFLPIYEDTGVKMILWYPVKDYKGPPENWRQYLEEEVIPLLKAGKKLAVFCFAGHGRTGLFIASLIALLEDPAETPDPIRALRKRYCDRAVETLVQEAAVLALRG